MSRKRTPHDNQESQRDLIKIGVSSCLLGQKVRFDGGHKHDRYITEILSDSFRFVPVCPELEVGMGVPREPVQLEGSPENPSMIALESGKNWTAAMNRYAEKRVKERDLSDICGYILKKNSPSCGMERVKIYGASKTPQTKGVGLFAAALIKRYPLLPVEEEDRLSDTKLRDDFIARVFAYSRHRSLSKKNR